MSRSIPYIDVRCNKCRDVVLKVSFGPNLDVREQLREAGWLVSLNRGDICPHCIEQEDVYNSGGGFDGER